MSRALSSTTLLAAALAAVGALAPLPARAADRATEQAVARKLYDLGYPTDHKVAVQRWRADTDRRGTGPLSDLEISALLAHPLPEFFAAMTGNPFTGMGIAVRHASRAAAEQDALRQCRKQGGGSACTQPMVTRTEHCVVIVGYNVTIDRRPTYRVSVAVSPDTRLSLDRATEGCQTGATHPQQCRPLVSYCGDGRDLQVHDGSNTVEAAIARAEAADAHAPAQETASGSSR